MKISRDLSMEALLRTLEKSQPSKPRPPTPQEWEERKRKGAELERPFCTIPNLRSLAELGDKLERKTGGVYFIQSGEDGPIKIGRAQNIYSRRSELQGGNPELLYIRAYIPLKYVADLAEELLHMYFAQFRLRGEWFCPSAVGEFLFGATNGK